MTIRYEVQISNAFGVQLTPQQNGGGIGDANLYSSLSWSRVVNDVGVLVITYAGELLPQLLRPDNIITVYRIVNGVPQLITETAWLLRRVRRALDSQGRLFTEITAYSGNYLLSSRGIAYAVRSAFSTKSGNADNLIKAYVRENLGSSATDTARIISQFTVQADSSQGQSIDLVAGWRDNLLIVAQELAEASTVAGTYIAFDCVYQGAAAWDLRTYSGQRGMDRRVPGSNFGFLLGTAYGNVNNVEYVTDWSETTTAAYGLGTGLGARRNVQIALDAPRIAESPYGRREAFIDASNASTVNQVLRVARAAVRAGRPRQSFRAQITETPASRFGIDWNWGDYVTVTALGVTVDARIDAVAVKVEQGSETIDAYVRAE